MADTTTELEVLDEIVDVLGGQSGQYETVVPVLEDIRDLLGGGGGGGGSYNPSLSVGRADALTGADTTAQWATRESTGSSTVIVRSVQGAVEVQDSMLVPVRIAGIRSVGFNQWDEEWEQGCLDITSGVPSPATNTICSKNYCRIIPDQTYYLTCSRDDGGSQNRFYAAILFYDESKAFISYAYRNRQTFTAPSNAAYFKLCTNTSTVVYGGTYTHDICVNLSDPARNGEYKPYTTDSIEWSAQTLRAAGSVADVLYSDHVDVKVGAVDLGTLNWELISGGMYFVVRNGLANAPAKQISTATIPNAECVRYSPAKWSELTSSSSGLDDVIGVIGAQLAVKDTSYTTVADLKASLAGVYLFYELGTPTTQPISPALPMTYRVEQGGTESIIVPTGEISAPPVLTIAEGESAGELVMDALACIAAPDGPVATSNHAINTYLTMQGKLYKVTSAIAVGETIKSGTNVTETTVMAELIARTA